MMTTMTPNKKSIRQEIEILRNVLAGKFEFRESLFISSCSRFGDSLWDWFDRSKERFHSYDPNRLKIDWPKLKEKHNLTDSIIADLQRFAFIRLAHGREMFSDYKGSWNAHPATLVNEVDVLTRFLGHLRRQTPGDGPSLIVHLSDIEVEDLEYALANYPSRTAALKKALTYLCHPNLSLLFQGGRLKWNKYDLQNLKWLLNSRKPYERVPDELFRFLSNRATDDVKQFLVAMKIEPLDTTELGAGENIFLAAFSSFHDFFIEYCSNHDLYLARGLKAADTKYTVWCNKRKGTVKQLAQLIDHARKAAQIIIILYTGARLSELNSFKTDCVAQSGDQWVLKGTEIKRRSLWAPALQDQWIAIPIVRDAVKVLNLTMQPAKSDHLFHTIRPSKLNKAPTSATYKAIFDSYLKFVAAGTQWSKETLHLYRFRHTLAFQLRKARLGIPFISYQLKHFYDAINQRLNDVTLVYGNLGGEAAIQAITDANRIFVEQVYHPEAPLAGGGAELHKNRRAAYFKGMALRGKDVDEVIDAFIKKGSPLTDVGTALCSGQREIVLDGVKQDPPCIGGLRCNPLICPSAIIPAYKQSAWKRVATENRQRAEDPQFAHARAYHDEAAEQAEAVVEYFQIQRLSKK